MKKSEQRQQTRPSPSYLPKLRQKRPLYKQVFKISKAKKLVLVLAISALVTGVSKEAPEMILDRVSCIHYPVQFRKNKEKAIIWALIDSGIEINAMTPVYAKQLGLWTCKTDVGAQKFNGSLLPTHGMVIIPFQMKDKLGRVWFFQETFLLADTSMKMVLGMLFLIFSNRNIQFTEKKLIWRYYTAKETLPTTQRVEPINKKEFAKAALDKHIEAFVVHVSFPGLESKMTIHPARKAQIALLLAEKVPVPIKSLDFADVFSKKSAEVLSEHTGINEHVI